MIVATIIKIALICTGIFTGILAIASFKKRNNSPEFGIIWTLSSVAIILAGIFMNPRNWYFLVGTPTLLFGGILVIALIVLLYNLTKNQNVYQKKINEINIQLTALKDENEHLIANLHKTKLDISNITNSLNIKKTKPIKNKIILLVINTMGTGGAETSLLEYMKQLIANNNTLHLFVITGQGELSHKIPKEVKLLNEHFDSESVLTEDGKKLLQKKVIVSQAKNATGLKLLKYQLIAYKNMLKSKKIYPEKLVWRAMAESAPANNNKYDIAIAYTEGASTYYVAERINAKKKIAFVHIAYEKAGYTRQLDQDAYQKIDEICTVSNEIKTLFLKVHPECWNKTRVFENSINVERITQLAETGERPLDACIKIVSVGRLVQQKNFKLSIDAANILKNAAVNFKWYILGDGPEKEPLKNYIEANNLSENVILTGYLSNPYAYMKYSDVYVHATKYEGKSVAIREAKALGCAIVVSDAPGNKEQVEHMVNGLVCQQNSKSIADNIQKIINNPNLAMRIRNNAKIN